MYSTLPPVLAELIANAHDADAETVTLTLNDENEEKEIVVEDDGDGMSFDEINRKFLRIGRNRRTDDKCDVTPKGRKIIGKKGLGKLSFFGIAHQIKISTRQAGQENIFSMEWEDIMTEEGEYRPKILERDAPCLPEAHGTKIVLRQIQRLTDFTPDQLANSLSKMFIIDSDFKVKIIHNSKDPIFVSNDRRFSSLDKEVEWKVPSDSKYEDNYDNADRIVGRLMATKKPIPENTNMRGITLFSRNKLVNSPKYFSGSTSSHFFSYLTGWLKVDFIDDLEEDVIATNRQSLNWGHEEMADLHNHLHGLTNWLERDWRKKRKEKREKKISDETKINLPDWFGKLPEDIRGNVEPLITTIIGNAELPDETHNDAVRRIHNIAPEYPRYHWRHLHSEVRAASRVDYQRSDYYRAFYEAVKRYVDAVKRKSGSEQTSGSGIMGDAFGKNNHALLQVAAHYKKPDGNAFQSTTIQNIQEGQKHLSMGVVTGGRNPLSHEEISDLRDSHLFTEKDCLDALSLLSHLFTRLDKAQKKT